MSNIIRNFINGSLLSKLPLIDGIINDTKLNHNTLCIKVKLYCPSYKEYADPSLYHDGEKFLLQDVDNETKELIEGMHTFIQAVQLNSKCMDGTFKMLPKVRIVHNRLYDEYCYVLIEFKDNEDLETFVGQDDRFVNFILDNNCCDIRGSGRPHKANPHDYSGIIRYFMDAEKVAIEHFCNIEEEKILIEIAEKITGIDEFEISSARNIDGSFVNELRPLSERLKSLKELVTGNSAADDRIEFLDEILDLMLQQRKQLVLSNATEFLEHILVVVNDK